MCVGTTCSSSSSAAHSFSVSHLSRSSLAVRSPPSLSIEKRGHGRVLISSDGHTHTHTDTDDTNAINKAGMGSVDEGRRQRRRSGSKSQRVCEVLEYCLPSPAVPLFMDTGL